MRKTLALGIGLAGLALVAATPAPVSVPDYPLPTFEDITEKAGIRFAHSYGDYKVDNIVEATGSGACVFDFDGDGLRDVYFPNARWMKGVSDNRGRDLIGKLSNALYRNKGDGTFEDVTEKAGVPGKGSGFGCAAADYDNDGDIDLYVLNYGKNELYRNNGDGTFTDVTEKAGVGDERWSLNAVFFDYDRDGDLDLFVCNYLEYDEGAFRSFYATAGFPGPLSYNGSPSTLYRNNGDGTFTDVTKQAKVYEPGGRGMSAIAVDLNGDGYLDIYQANDNMESYYYENKKDGTFEERALFLGLAFGQHGQGVSHMGPFATDVNSDGLPDLLIPDMDYGSLLMNKGQTFVDAIDSSGLAVICGQYTGWGAVVFDYDNDGSPDAFVANGHPHHEYPEDAVLARGDGKGRFEDVARASGDFFQKKWVSRGATWLDYDNDGNVDLLVIDLNGPPHLLRNNGGTGNNWIKIDARVLGGKRTAIGARIRLVAGGREQVQSVLPVNGYLSQGDDRLHFGIGREKKVELVEITWPDGKRKEIRDLEVNRVVEVTQE